MSKKQQNSLLLEVLTTLIALVFFVILPYAMYSTVADAYHFFTSEQTTMGKVLSTEYHGRKSRYTIFFSYTAADGMKRQGKQEITEGDAWSHYPAGAPLKLRYKDGHAFIDNGKHNKLWMLLLLPIMFIFWSLMAFVLAGELGNACRFIFSKHGRSTQL